MLDLDNLTTMRHPLMNLVNTTLSQKYGDPKLKVSIYGSVLKSSLYRLVKKLGKLSTVLWHSFAVDADGH